MLLISCCNLPEPAPTCLVSVDPVTGRTTPAPINCLSGSVRSGLGLVRNGDDLWHVHMDDAWRPHVAVLDAVTLQPISDHALEGAEDPHSLCAVDGGFAVASTGTDEVLAYRWAAGEPEPGGALWAAGEERRDEHHVNSLTVWQGRLFCSAFGPKAGGSWANAVHGYVLDVLAGRTLVDGLRHPHSLVVAGDQLLLCESATGRVLDVTPDGGDVRDARAAPTLMAHDAYLRGLAVDPTGYLYVGTSLSRNKSKSRGVELSPDERRASAGFVGVLENVLGLTNPLTRLDGIATEVYDLLVV